jgi:uncharacterized protein involved in exopolysaccharide biosynthesis
MPEEQYDEINLMEVIGIIKKNIFLILLLFFVFVFSSGIITYFFIPKTYQSNTTFYLEEKGSSSGALAALSSQLGALGGLVPGISGGGTKAELCSEIILSRKFLGEILSEQGLPAEPEDIINLRSVVTIDNKKSGAMQISVKWTDPQTAFALTDQIFKKYKQVVEEQINTNNSSNKSFLEEQYQKSLERLTLAEEALLSYQKEKGIIYLPEQATKTIGYLAELEKQKVEAEVGLREARERLKKTDAQLSTEAPMIKSAISETANPFLGKFKESLAQIEQELAQARKTYMDEHPVIQKLLAGREELLRNMELEKELILSGETRTVNPIYQTLAGGYLAGQIEVAGLEARFSALKKVCDDFGKMVAELPDSMLQYGRLLREQKVAEQVYMLLVTQLEQAKISEAKEENVVIQVIDPPVAPHKKHSPSTVTNMAIAGLLALFLGVFWAFFREYLSNYKEGMASKADF